MRGSRPRTRRATGISLAAQKSRIEAYCDSHGLRLARIEEDAGISAKKTTNRPALQRALVALRKGEATGLVAVKLDRLSRTTRDVSRATIQPQICISRPTRPRRRRLDSAVEAGTCV